MPCVSPIHLPFEHPFLNSNYLDVPCGKCLYCLNKRKLEWAFRVIQESNNNACTFFVTLTYDEDCLPKDNNGCPTLVKKDLQKFIKRIRKDMANQNIHLRYFGVGEYGSKFNRPHYHVVCFVDNFITLDEFACYVLRAWKFAHPYVTARGCEIPRSNAAFMYVAKYVLKNFDPFLDVDVQKPFMICSLKPAIGANYLTDDIVYMHRKRKMLYGVLDGGVKVPLPRYYRNKIWSEEERKVLFSQYLLEHGNIVNQELEDLINSLGYVEGNNRYHQYYDDMYYKSQRIFNDKHSL